MVRLGEDYPIDCKNKGESLASYTMDGKYYKSDACPSVFNSLPKITSLPKPKRMKTMHEEWCSYLTKEEAKRRYNLDLYPFGGVFPIPHDYEIPDEENERNKMKVLAIDPGPIKSAYVLWDGVEIRDMGIWGNYNLLNILAQLGTTPILAIEMVASYGMPVGKDIFETCVWIGRFIQAWNGEYKYIYRRDVKMYLCNATFAKDSNVRQAIIDLFPPTGGGKIPQIGIKAQKGPLYGVHDDLWAALGVAITWEKRYDPKP